MDKQIIKNKCPSCGYEGVEKVCVKCGLLMEEECEVCHYNKSDCICELSKKVEIL